MTTPQTRIEAAILEAYDNDYDIAPREVAEALVDEDVAAGRYEGCSSDLEGWFGEYEALASRALGVRS